MTEKDWKQDFRINPEQLHEWYLEATKKLNPESFNEKAQKPFKELTKEQQFIDCFIADKIAEHIRKQLILIEEHFKHSIPISTHERVKIDYKEDISDLKERLNAQLKLNSRYAHEITRLEIEIEELKRQINCVKDHPEIKPVNCCWTADSLMMQEHEDEIKELQKEIRELKNHEDKHD